MSDRRSPSRSSACTLSGGGFGVHAGQVLLQQGQDLWMGQFTVNAKCQRTGFGKVGGA